MKKIFWFKILPILVLVGVILILNRLSWQGEDVTILSINGDKVEMINMSADRGVVNSYSVENLEIWVPNGMGWYPASRWGLIVKDDVDLAKKIAFYNFGFWPKHVVNRGGWTSNKSLISILGPIGWLRFLILSDDWLWRKDVLELDNLAEIMPRDLADNKVLKTDLKINIVNSSLKNGFGNMIADRLEWWGLMVTSVQTGEAVKKCSLYFNFKSDYKYVVQSLAKIMNCDQINREGVVELVLGTDIEEMVKYSQTYVRSF